MKLFITNLDTKDNAVINKEPLFMHSIPVDIGYKSFFRLCLKNIVVNLSIPTRNLYNCSVFVL